MALGASLVGMNDALNLDTSPTGNEAKWERNFALLEEFARLHGHARVPQGHQVHGVKLGDWARTQKTAHRAGRLRQDRSDRLEALGALA